VTHASASENGVGASRTLIVPRPLHVHHTPPIELHSEQMNTSKIRGSGKWERETRILASRKQGLIPTPPRAPPSSLRAPRLPRPVSLGFVGLWGAWGQLFQNQQ